MAVRARERLIVALDFPFDPTDRERLMRADDVDLLVDELDELVDVVKVGWPLYMAGGNEVVRRLRARGKRVFLDLKFGDIAETVRRLIKVAMEQEVSFTTLATSMQGVRAAAEAKGSHAALTILTVTLLTSLDAADLRELGFSGTVEEYVRTRSLNVRQAGGDGIVASGREAGTIREAIPDRGFVIITPGIRPKGVGVDDHKRAVTPEDAIGAGADYLVVGRPITKADSPRDAARMVLDEMQRAFDRRRG